MIVGVFTLFLICFWFCLLLTGQGISAVADGTILITPFGKEDASISVPLTLSLFIPLPPSHTDSHCFLLAL